MKLSNHLSVKEATYSATAIKHGINNEPNIAQLEVLKEIAKAIFEPCRKFVGGPLRVSSGFRSLALNQRIGGSLSSDHMINDEKTAAFDLDCDTYNNGNNAELFHYIRTKLEFKQLIWEFGGDVYEEGTKPNWVHVAWSTDSRLNKGEVLLAKREGRRTVYEYYKAK
jgi:zinc D-Ala-D-Ala carboxypeptidase